MDDDDARHELDLDLLNELAELAAPGQDEFVAMVVETYIRTTTLLLDRLARAIDAGDTNGIEMEAHSLKSSSASVGAIGLASHAQRIEAEARAGSTAAASALADQLRAGFERFRRAVAVYLRQT